MSVALRQAEVESAQTGANIPTVGPVGRWLLDGITLDYGPIDLLGRFFLQADTALRARGITLNFGTLDDLVAVNRRNPDTWRPLISIFDPAFGAIHNDNSFVLLGRDRAGQVVATQAARLYAWGNTNFAKEATSLRLFYPDPSAQCLPNEKVVVTAKSAERVQGSVVFSGGVWFDPSHRGQFLTGILPEYRARVLSRGGTPI